MLYVTRLIFYIVFACSVVTLCLLILWQWSAESDRYPVLWCVERVTVISDT